MSKEAIFNRRTYCQWLNDFLTCDVQYFLIGIRLCEIQFTAIQHFLNILTHDIVDISQVIV
jgi:hypothetical protein